ncbi:MAG: 3-oxoacyl-[acyl-carrier-protein] synthase III C-terminal domain-containing protein [Bacteroidota bacterium]
MQYGCKIESIGVKLPEKRLSTTEIEKQLSSSRSLKLEMLTGISSRRVCNQYEDSLSLAVDAARDCLKYSGFDAGEIEMIISCSISKYVNGLNHYYEPALSLMIKDKIGNTKALNFDIMNACAGMVTGIHIANNFISQGKVKNCLVVSGEYITHIGKNALKSVISIQHPEMASLTVGDAGAAVMLTQTNRKEDSLWVSEMTTLSRFSNLCTGYQSPDYPGAVMKTDMKTIHEVSLQNVPSVVENALKKADIKFRDIDYFIPHQTAKISIKAGARILSKYFREKPGEVVINLSETGNTASTTHFVTLYQYLKKGKFKKGDKIMLVSFASGLVIGSVVFPVNEIVNRYGNNN